MLYLLGETYTSSKWINIRRFWVKYLSEVISDSSQIEPIVYVCIQFHKEFASHTVLIAAFDLLLSAFSAYEFLADKFLFFHDISFLLLF